MADLVPPNNNPAAAAAEEAAINDAAFPRRSPQSLFLQCQIAVLRPLQLKASGMEKRYMDTWTGSLNKGNVAYEQGADIRGPEVDTTAVVREYGAKMQAEAIKKLEEKANKKARQTKAKKDVASMSNGGGGGGGGKSRRGGGISSRFYPYERKEFEAKKTVVDPVKVAEIMTSCKLVKGIPQGLNAKEYIVYRKCRYIEEIARVRRVLADRLSRPVLDALMSSMCNVAQFNNKHEHGLLTLQAFLMNTAVRSFRVAPASLYKNFLPHSEMSSLGFGGSVFDKYGKMAEADDKTTETRMPTTILHFMLRESERLTHLDLERCAHDSLLKVIASSAPNLVYLNISSSVVSDEGLLHLCGVQRFVARESIGRACKSKAMERIRQPDSGQKPKKAQNEAKRNAKVFDKQPMWEQTSPGCQNIVHLKVRICC